MAIDVVAAARKYLAQQASVLTVLGSDSIWDLWLFQEKLLTKVESSGKVACVLKQKGSWTSPNTYNTARFPRLVTEFYADPDRDSKNNVVTPLSAKDRILAAHEVIDSFLHIVSGKENWWPSFGTTGACRILRSTRQGELDWFDVPEGDGVLQGTVSYAIGLG